MNFLEEEKRRHKKKKTERRRKFFNERRPEIAKKSGKVCCGVYGCPNEAIKLIGRMPNCGQHK